jgi:glyoxylase-like metal-dependent hydrolase (beta-lactamase superfamily II)
MAVTHSIQRALEGHRAPAMRDNRGMAGPRKRELARADRVLPGVWRLRLPLPWLGVPHGNAYAVAAGSGVVLFDTGMHEPGSFAQLERALAQAGLGIEHIRLVVCTHAHADHYGMAAPICEAAGCELWMHPDHAHMTAAAQDPEASLERRIEVARHSGVPMAALERYREENKDRNIGVASVRLPDRDLVAGVEVETDLGRWRVVETPGHAPSHVVLHQPERRLLISGDHVLGRPSLFFDFGFTPDPVGEYLTGLERVRALDVDLILAGHGRPARDLEGHIDAHLDLVDAALERIRAALAGGPRTAFEIAGAGIGLERVPRAAMSWAMSLTLSYLRRLEVTGQAERVDGADPERWQLVKR